MECSSSTMVPATEDGSVLVRPSGITGSKRLPTAESTSTFAIESPAISGHECSTSKHVASARFLMLSASDARSIPTALMREYGQP